MAPELHARNGPALPATWDPGRDLLVWIGPDGPALPFGARVFRVPSQHEDATTSSGAPLVRDPGELFQAVLALTGVAPAHALVHRCPGEAPERAQAFAAGLRSALAARALQRRTLADAGGTWLVQGIGNLATLARTPTIAPLAGAFRGRPCVLVSPGPSLSRNLAQLPELARRAVVVSGTHALSALASVGLAPHLVVAADPGDLARHWAGLDLAGVGALVAGATCRAGTLAAPIARRFAFAANGATDAWLAEPLGELPGLATGGSVACSMLSLALHMGCDPVVFVGQDLSFGERFYAAEGLDGDAAVEHTAAGFVLVKPRGAGGIGTPLPDGRLRFTDEKKVLEVPGWHGGTVRTTPQLAAFRDWLEAVAPTLAELAGGTRLLNCTEGGARIAGFEHVPLAEAAAAWSEAVDVAPVLEQAASAADGASRRERAGEWCRRTLRALEDCVALAKRCAALARGDVPALARAEKKLSRALKAAPLVALVAQDEIAAARERARLARTLDENLAAARALFAVVERAGALLIPPLRAAWRELG